MLKYIMQHPELIFVALFFVGPALASLLKAKRKTANRTPPPASSRDSGGPSELERRVRENFEEILRRRRQETEAPRAEPDPPLLFEPDPAPPPPPPPPRPSPVPHPAVQPPAVARHAAPLESSHENKSAYAVDTDAYQTQTDAYQVTTETAYQVDIDAYRLDRKGHLKTAGELIHKTDLDRRALRRAVVWKEILDRPLGLREPRDQTF